MRSCVLKTTSTSDLDGRSVLVVVANLALFYVSTVQTLGSLAAEELFGW
jgi:hypothetical protein